MRQANGGLIMDAITIQSIARLRQTESGKYVADLNLMDHPQRTCWLSNKQATQLNKCFGNDDYSSKRKEVIGIFDGDRFVWCTALTPKKPEDKWIEEKFGVIVCPQYVQVFGHEPIVVAD
jgi:hypothetical protein